MRALVLLALAACTGEKMHAEVASTAPSEYPGVLHAPATLHPDFMVRQSLAIHTQHDGKPIEAAFDAVVQKQGDTLLVVGLGPMNVKAFTLTEKGDKITFDQYAGPPLPFSPRNIIVDIHRVFFMRLPVPSDPQHTGVVTGELDGEHVEEIWKAGQLTQIAFTRPNTTFRGAVRISLGDGCTVTTCQPASATLRNEWFGYTLVIHNDAFEPL